MSRNVSKLFANEKERLELPNDMHKEFFKVDKKCLDFACKYRAKLSKKNETIPGRESSFNKIKKSHLN